MMPADFAPSSISATAMRSLALSSNCFTNAASLSCISVVVRSASPCRKSSNWLQMASDFTLRLSWQAARWSRAQRHKLAAQPYQALVHRRRARLIHAVLQAFDSMDSHALDPLAHFGAMRGDVQRGAFCILLDLGKPPFTYAASFRLLHFFQVRQGLQGQFFFRSGNH